MTADELLAEIQQRYRALQRLPGPEYSLKRQSPAYTALEAEIRTLAELYSKISGTGDGSASHVSTLLGEPHAGAGQ